MPTVATAPSPADRYQSVLALQRDILKFLRGGLYLQRKGFAAGDVIIKEGDVGDAAYMIVNGRCRAYRSVGDEEETLSVMEAGDVFGEMALLLDGPRAASDAIDGPTGTASPCESAPAAFPATGDRRRPAIPSSSPGRR